MGDRWERANEALKFKLFGNTATTSYGEYVLKGNGTIYWLKELLGKGGYGSVYEAEDLSTQQNLAIKVMNQYHSQKDTIAESDVNELMGTKQGNPIVSRFGKNAILMKLIKGRKLETELLDPGSLHDPLTLYRDAKQLIKQLHKLGYSHGDSNSGNFIVTSSGQVFMIDFGASRPFQDLESRIKDYEKLAGNVVEELKFREEESAVICRQEAMHDLKNAEELVQDRSLRVSLATLH